MPFAFPTLPALRQQTRAFFTARLPGADARLRRNSIQVTADLTAGALWLMYFYLAWLAKQLFADTSESTYLERDGVTYGIRREGPGPALGLVLFSGVAGSATPIPAGTQVQSVDGTVQYLTQAAGTIGSTGEVSILIEAVTGGSAGNAVAGTPLTLQTAIAGVLPDVVVDTAGLSGGTDSETDDELRIRILTRKRKPPQGGAPDDYVAWAKTVPGVTRVWVYRNGRGAGTVDVLFVMDDRTSIIPLPSDVAAVQAVLDQERPVTADVLAAAPLTMAVPVTIADLISGTAIVRAAVATQLAALFASATPGGAVYGDGVTTESPGGTTFREAVSAAVSETVGVSSFDLIVPAADVVAPRYTIAVLGTVSYQ